MISLTTHAPTTCAPALIRFVADGLLATIDAHLAGDLSLHRFARELRARIDTLDELHPPARTVTRLRWLQRDVEHLYAVSRDAGRTELTADERAHLAGTVRTLRGALTALLPPNPLDPAGAARPVAWELDPAGAVRPVARRRVATSRRPSRRHAATGTLATA